MDKELPESALGIKPPKSYIRVSKSNLPGYKGYKASVIFRSTIGIETIAERIVKKRNVYGKETLVTAFNIIKTKSMRPSKKALTSTSVSAVRRSLQAVASKAWARSSTARNIPSRLVSVLRLN